MAKSKLTPADNKFIAKFLKNKLNFDAKEKLIRANRFTSEKFEVDPISAAALDFVFQVEPVIDNASALARINPELKLTNVISNFDRARMIVLKLDADAYMGILD